MKFTFKKQPRITGLAGIGYPQRSVDIKLNGRKVGEISPPNWKRNDFQIWLTIFKKDINEDGNPNSKWRNIHLGFIPMSEDDAREFLQKYIETIIEKFTLYSVDTEEFYLDGKWNKI